MTVSIATRGIIAPGSVIGNVVRIITANLEAHIDGRQLQANLDSYLSSIAIVDEKAITGETSNINCDAEIVDHEGTARRC